MKIEHQVVSVGLAKELKEVGVKQESLWFWSRCAIVSSTEYGQGDMRLMLAGFDPLSDRVEHYSAYTVAELGEMLPGRIKTDYGSWNYLHTTKLENTNEWFIAYFNDELKGSSEADARAKMLLYLIKEKIIKVGEVGK